MWKCWHHPKDLEKKNKSKMKNPTMRMCEDVERSVDNTDEEVVNSL